MITLYGMLILSDSQASKEDEFYKNHVMKCTAPIKVPEVKGYRIWSSGIGPCVTYSCKCGETIDLTDVSDW
jgi:hypothetical protein